MGSGHCIRSPFMRFRNSRRNPHHLDLRALDLRLRSGSGLPAVDKMRSWFEKKGEPVPVHGVDLGWYGPLRDEFVCFFEDR